MALKFLRSLEDSFGLAALDGDSLCGLFVRRLQLLDQFESAHAHDDAAEDHVLVVEEGEWGAHRHVELALVRVRQTVSLAHAKHADFAVLDMEGLVLKRGAIDGGTELTILRGRNLAHLKVHALDDTRDISAHVGQLLTISTFVAGAKSEEVCNGARSDVHKELEVNRLGSLGPGDSEVNLGVPARLGVVDSLLEGVGCETLVDDAHRVVHVGEAVQDVSGELLRVANVLLIVEQDQVVTRMLVEHTLQLVGNLLDVLLPLGLKEDEALAGDDIWVLFLEVLDRRYALVEGRVLNFARHRDFDWCLVRCRRAHL